MRTTLPLLTCLFFFVFFFFNDTATTEIYTLSLHDALPISCHSWAVTGRSPSSAGRQSPRDRKSTRLNSSHDQISYAVFCLKKNKKQHIMKVILSHIYRPAFRSRGTYL